MRAVLSMARRGLGRTWPNPSVGCVIVKNGAVIARAHTADGGRPHAETLALQLAGPQAEGADIYVTLEPCSHHGQTPPCVDAIIKAKPRRVIVGMLDPDERVSGAGIAKLARVGIPVFSGVLEDELQQFYRGYILNRTQNRPEVTLKLAVSADGKIARGNGRPVWVTGGQARAYGHLERSQHDAIAAGSGTVQADNPMLDVRYGLYPNDLVRVVYDTHMSLSPGSRIVQTACKHKVIAIVAEGVSAEKMKPYGDASVDILKCPVNNNEMIDIPRSLQLLAEKGITRLLVEGGPTLVRSFLDSGLTDRFLLFTAPDRLGEAGANALGISLEDFPKAYNLKLIHTRRLGTDRLDIFEKGL